MTGYIQDIYVRLLNSQLDSQAIQAHSTLVYMPALRAVCCQSGVIAEGEHVLGYPLPWSSDGQKHDVFHILYLVIQSSELAVACK